MRSLNSLPNQTKAEHVAQCLNINALTSFPTGPGGPWRLCAPCGPLSPGGPLGPGFPQGPGSPFQTGQHTESQTSFFLVLKKERC